MDTDDDDMCVLRCVCVCVCLCMRVCVCNCIGAPCVQGITLHIIPLFFLRHWHNIQYTCMYSSLYVCVCVCVWLCVHRCWFIKKLSADEGSSYQARKKKKKQVQTLYNPTVHSQYSDDVWISPLNTQRASWYLHLW